MGAEYAVVGNGVGALGRDLILHIHFNHSREFGLHCRCDKKSLEGFETGSDFLVKGGLMQ